MGITNASVVVFKGSVKINNNRGEGIAAGAYTALEVREGSLEVSGNATNGIFLSGASLNIGIGCSLGCRIMANDNGGDGLSIGGGQLVIGGNAPPGNTVVTAMNNKGSGVNLLGFSSLVNTGTGRFVLKGNAVGLNVGSESSVLMIGGLDVENNATCLLADGAGSPTLVSIPPNPSAIRSNGAADVD
jgi:hypothetical protein